ncbi:MAG: hypothetical protein P8Z40_02685 [Chloroflexota bacterium]
MPGTCSRCHSAEGLPLYITEGVSITQPTANALSCTTCHDAVPGFTLYVSNEVTFPSGATLSFGEGDVSNLCMNCHQGRSSTPTVNAAIEGIGADTVDENLGFINIHYFAAGATLFGSEAQGAYQYPGKTYVGLNTHVPGADTCAECHNVHALQVNTEICAQCHGNVELDAIRMDDGEPIDYDGDGNTTEGIAGEIETIHEALWTAIEAYAARSHKAPATPTTSTKLGRATAPGHLVWCRRSTTISMCRRTPAHSPTTATTSWRSCTTAWRTSAAARQLPV